MNEKQLGLLRELLTAASAALIAYGIGTSGLWEEISGGIVAIVMLIWGIRSNAGWEALSSSLRKALSAAAGVLVMTGVLAPDKAEVLLGLALQFVSFGWSLWGKGGDSATPPAVPLLALLAALSFLLPSCTGVDGLGSVVGSVTVIDPTTGAKGGLTYEKGKPVTASLKAPLKNESGETIGYVDLKSSK
jgi:hypothetical protein